MNENIPENLEKNEPENLPKMMFKKPSKPKKQRPWKSENLPRVFTVRADDDEYNRLKKMAKDTGWSLSRLLIEATLHYGVKPAEEARAERDVFEKMIFEVRRVGINLNQISQRLNSFRRGSQETPPTHGELNAVLKEIESVLEKLRKKL